MSLRLGPIGACLAASLLAAGCPSAEELDPPPSDPTPSGPPIWPGEEVGEAEIGAPVPCSSPVEGFTRLVEEGAERGLTDPLPPTDELPFREGIGGSIVATDLDGDGDDDLLFGRPEAPPLVFLNDGTGRFDPGPILAPPPFPTFLSAPPGAADLTRDGRPDVITHLRGQVLVWPSTPAGWAPPQVWWEPAEPLPSMAWALAPADDDAWLDLTITTSFPSADPEGPVAPDPVLRGVDGGFEPWVVLASEGSSGAPSQVSLFTDRDRDGDADLLVVTNAHRRASAFYRQDRGADPPFVNDVDAVHADLRVAGMGIDSADLNGDGALDYCVTDVGPPRCLLSDPSGYVDVRDGLRPDVPANERIDTIGWAFDLADLDNDGFVDAVQGSGPDLNFEELGFVDFPDLIWQGMEGGTFEDRTAELGFGDLRPHYGLATADFDRDGWLDVIPAGPGDRPRLWMNRCGSAGWLDVELLGPEGNPQGYGARVEVTAGGRTQARELYAVRATGQSAARLHFGLGDSQVADVVRVLWPGGDSTTAERVGVRRVLRAVHPDAAP